MTTQKSSIWKLEDIDNFPTADLSSRGIKKETCEKYGVRQSYNQQTGERDKHLFFPSGEGEGCKRKNLKDKNDTEIIGSYRGLFGQDKFHPGGKCLFLTEGEEDALSVWQAYNSRNGADYTVCSIPLGAPPGKEMGKRAIWDFITSFTGVVLIFDQDEAGWEAVNKFAELYASSVAIKYAEFDAKDANELVKEGREDELIRAISRAKEYKPETVVAGEDVSLELVSEPIQPGHYFERFPALSERLMGQRLGELTTIIAPTGVGKSTMVAELAYDFLTRTDEKVGALFLEEDVKKASQRFIALDNNVPLPRYRLNPDLVSPEDREASYYKLICNGRTRFLDLPTGAIEPDRLIPLLRWYAKVEGCTRLIFDHISQVFGSDESSDERKAIDNTLYALRDFVKETGVTVICVSHIKRSKKIYGHDPILDCYWQIVDDQSARGSGAFEQTSWNLVSLEPEWTEDGERGRSRIRVLKSREWGSIGPADIIRMNPATGRLEALTEEF